MDKKYIVYTCITGGYDTLHEIKYLSPNIDYICFTDNLNLKSDTWKIIPLPNDIKLINSKVKQQRLIKILPHKYIPNASDYEASLWVDGNIEIVGDLNDFFLKYDISKKFLYVNKHPSRDCIYREQIAVIRYKKDTFENTNPQINRYRDEGFPEHYGLGETNILLRKHNDKCCIKTMDLWANELKNGSHRDQLSFNYAIWKTQCKDKIDYLCEKYYNIKITDNVFFSLVKHKIDMKFTTISNNKSYNTIDNTKINNSSVILNKQKEYPLVSIVFFTHNRTNVALETLKSLFKNLKYPNLNWIISDDRSTKEHLFEIDGLFKKYKIKYDLCQTELPKVGLGASMNNGLKDAFKYGDVVLTTEDDWYLKNNYNIDDKVKILLEDDKIAGIRIGALCSELGKDLKEDSKHKDFYKISKNNIKQGRNYIFNNQIMIRHKRIFDKIGYMKENCPAAIQENDLITKYNNFTNFGNNEEFKVLFPKNYNVGTLYGEKNPFFHIGFSTDPNVKRYVRKDFIYLNNPDSDKKLREKYINNDYFFKVIIPSYNSEKYIKQCIESIEMQTFTNYKIIIVDDVSNDKTRDILLSLQKKYNNINLIFLDKKVYAGGCRNIGADTNIKSLYTIFIDSDDYLIDKTAFQQIYDCINKNNNPDCVEISFKKEFCNKYYIAKSKTPIDILKYGVFAPWRKVTKSSILQKFVPNRIKGNDVVWTFRQVDKTNTIATIDKPLYFYRTSNENSVWNGFNKTNKTIKEENDSIFVLLKNDLENESFKIKEVEEYKKNEINLIVNKKGVYNNIT